MTTVWNKADIEGAMSLALAFYVMLLLLLGLTLALWWDYRRISRELAEIKRWEKESVE